MIQYSQGAPVARAREGGARATFRKAELENRGGESEGGAGIPFP